MQIIELPAKKREKVGKQASKQARREGAVPAVLYGHGINPVSVEVQEKDLLHALHTKAGENVVLDLKIDGANLKESTCLIKEMQHDPRTDQIAHVDFTIISLTETITVSIPVHVRNSEEAVGVKEGGVLDVIHHEVEVECLPTNIPEGVEIDIKKLAIGDIIYVKDVAMPEGVKCMLEDEEAFVTIHPPRVEEEEKPSEEAEQPEVIEKGKKAEEGEEGSEAAPAAEEKES